MNKKSALVISSNKQAATFCPMARGSEEPLRPWLFTLEIEKKEEKKKEIHQDTLGGK